MKKQLVLYDTLIESQDVDSIVAVVLHEMGHWYHSHFMQNILMSIFYIGFLLFSFQFSYESKRLQNAFHLKHASNAISFFFFLFFISPIQTLYGFATCFLTRKKEYEADEFAVKNGKGKELKNALIKLFKKDKSDVWPDKLYSTLNHTHPTLL